MSKKFLVALALPLMALAACKNTTASVTDDTTTDAAVTDDAAANTEPTDDSAMENNEEPTVDANAAADVEAK